MKIYLAGPMRGYKDFNFPAFKAAAALLRADGHSVFSPAEQDIKRQGGVDIAKGTSGELAEIEVQGFSIRDAIFDDLEYIIREADAIALLPGWEASKGVAAELATAKFLNLEIITLI